MALMERHRKLEQGVNLAPPRMRADRALVLAAIRYLVMGAVERELWVAWR